MFSMYEWKEQHEHSTKYLFIFMGKKKKLFGFVFGLDWTEGEEIKT